VTLTERHRSGRAHGAIESGTRELAKATPLFFAEAKMEQEAALSAIEPQPLRDGSTLGLALSKRMGRPCWRIPIINQDYPMLDKADLVGRTVSAREGLQ
jgi:hypothetical protein